MTVTNERLLRLPEVLRYYPICRASWYHGVKEGKYPKPVQISARSVAWRLSDILALIERTGTQDAGQGGLP